MAQKFANAARGFLSAGIIDTDTTISISSGGSLFPVANGTDWFRAVLQDETGIEVVQVTGHTSGADTFTVVRAQEGTTARSFALGSVFGLRVTAADSDNWRAAYDWGDHSTAGYLDAADIGVSVQAYDADLTTWGGKTAPSGGVVGTTDTQTLSNKGLTTIVSGTAGPTGSGGSAALQVMGDSTNGAYLTFHRSGVWAGNLGLDTSNVLRYGGWSAGTGVTLFGVTSTGVMEVRRGVYFGSQHANGNSGTAITVNFANGQKQALTLTGNCTVTLSFPGVGNYQLILTQDATGNRTVTWSGVSRYVGSATAPAINTAANSSTVVSFYYDGTNTWVAASKVNA